MTKAKILYSTAQLVGVESVTCWSQVQHSTLSSHINNTVNAALQDKTYCKA